MTPLEAQNKNKRCSSHHDHGHTTEECMSLKRHIEDLVGNGYLNSYFKAAEE